MSATDPRFVKPNEASGRLSERTIEPSSGKHQAGWESPRQHVMMRILRGVGSLSLPCGCLVGFYETYGAETLAILDVRAPACSDPTHRTGDSIDVKAVRAQDPSPDRKT